MLTSDWIALSSLGMSIIAIIISFLSSTKKYELLSEQRNNVLDWFYQTTEVLITLKLMIKDEVNDIYEFNGILSKLSALIELGRFYFPNVDKKDGFGDDKPSAYRGYRNIVLEFLVFYYDICQKENADEYIHQMEILQRLFTSTIFDILPTNKYNKFVKRYTGVAINPNMNLNDFLSNDSQADYFRLF